MGWGLVAGIALFALIIAGSVAFYLHERQLVRAGHCGKPWRVTGADSQGGIQIVCPRCGEYQWVSWYHPRRGECHGWISPPESG